MTTAGTINLMLEREKNPDVKELLRLHLEVAMKKCGHPNKKIVGGDGEHSAPSVWCVSCEMWV